MTSPTQGVPGCPDRYCNKCGYHGPDERHFRPYTTIDCDYSSVAYSVGCTAQSTDERTAKSETPVFDDNEITTILDTDGKPRRCRGKFVPFTVAKDLEQKLNEATEQLAALTKAADYTIRRLQADIDDGSRPDQWSMEAIVSDLTKAINADTSALDTLKAQWQREARVEVLREAKGNIIDLGDDSSHLDAVSLSACANELSRMATAIEAGGSDEKS